MWFWSFTTPFGLSISHAHRAFAFQPLRFAAVFLLEMRHHLAVFHRFGFAVVAEPVVVGFDFLRFCFCSHKMPNQSVERTAVRACCVVVAVSAAVAPFRARGSPRWPCPTPTGTPADRGRPRPIVGRIDGTSTRRFGRVGRGIC